MEKGSAKEWFDEWFDSPYYHILYKNRDLSEAKAFVDRLCSFFGCSPAKHVLDLACGKGRYSLQLRDRGMVVTGVDLSAQSIAYARQFEDDYLHFDVHDMRKVYKKDTFDIVLNLFTSFGYFSTNEENQQAIIAAAQSLKPGGQMLIDFLNTPKTIKELEADDVKTIEGITFYITRYLNQDRFIVKDIQFEDQGKTYHFQERVRAISEEDFRAYFEKAGLRVKKVFGDYHLHDYDAAHSKRMIFLTEK
ncbi:class I SAM-dependent methyltransferase [Porifericola rhodea]|uniref:SAM-dependent methyltransferase n=1 Tax=Porifericola rhodea TaxID=930972 RepID=UPI0026668298|nr:class I SAM-dependent methyltransferase [Porifericola rhodea]WKN30030.1 class I SAM-dependent methyltransferase [Porifericola rhodea]